MSDEMLMPYRKKVAQTLILNKKYITIYDVKYSSAIVKGLQELLGYTADINSEYFIYAPKPSYNNDK